MTPERWAQIEDLFHRAADCDPQRLTAFLDESCRNDPDLREQVESLLSCDQNARDNVRAAVRSEFEALAFSLIGKRVSHYRILGGLGGGGMGLVYCAEDIKLGRRVAIKFLPEDSAKDPSALNRFEREARSASALEHPNICPIYEFGEHDGQPFIVMPLLDGQTLEQFVAEQGIPTHRQQFQKLLDIAIQVTKGLEVAHGHGIIHRDIKPSNLFLTVTGQAKILDFGIAKLARADINGDSRAASAPQRAPTLNTVDLTLSRTGKLVGTAAYMSPEQVRGEEVDARTDIFSFGLVLYELATGRRAFGGDSWPLLQEAVLKEVPKTAHSINQAVPATLDDIINKCIEKQRSARFQSAAEMRVVLETLQRQLMPRHLPRTWATGLAVGGAVVLAAITFLLTRPPKTISVTPEIKLRQLTTNSSENPVRAGAISPDGRFLAYIDARGLELKTLDTGEIRTIPLPPELNTKRDKWEIGAWFPDSARFLMDTHPATEDWNEWSSAATSIWAISIKGETPTKVRDHAVLSSISPDGSTIAFATNRGKRGEREIWFMGPNGENPRKFFGVTEDNAICCFSWSLDGKRYGYVLTDSSGDNMLSRDRNGGPPITVLSSSELMKMDDIVWLHDDRVIYSLHETENSNVCNYWTMRLDLGSGKRIEEPRRLTNWPNFCVSSGSSTEDDKKVAFLASSNFYTSYIATFDRVRTGISDLKHFTLEDSDDVITDWTPDGKAVVVAQNRRDHYSLYKQRVDSQMPEPIVSSMAGGLVNFAEVTPDGKWIIAFIWPVVNGVAVERPPVPLPLVRIPLTGGVPETILQLSRPSPVSCARTSTDLCVIVEPSENGKQMIVSSLDAMKGRGPELARFNLAREVDVFVDNLICALSPDGTRLAIARGPESPVEIHSLHGELIGKIPSHSLGNLINVVWAPDQNGIFLTRKAADGTELLHLDLKGHLQSLRKCVGRACFGFPSPDGRHIAILENNQSRNMWMMENF